jgi:hypothetical protein
LWLLPLMLMSGLPTPKENRQPILPLRQRHRPDTKCRLVAGVLGLKNPGDISNAAERRTPTSKPRKVDIA